MKHLLILFLIAAKIQVVDALHTAVPVLRTHVHRCNHMYGAIQICRQYAYRYAQILYKQISKNHLQQTTRHASMTREIRHTHLEGQQFSGGWILYDCLSVILDLLVHLFFGNLARTFRLAPARSLQYREMHRTRGLHITRTLEGHGRRS